MPEPLSSNSKGTILTVDDALYVRTALKNALEPKGFHILQASDGSHAKSLLESYEGELSLILLDIIMPRMGGIEFLQYIRGEGLNTPVVMLSAASSKKILMECAGLGISGFLTKPLILEQVYEKVGEILNMDLQEAEPQDIRLLVMDTNSRSKPQISKILEASSYRSYFPECAESCMECVENLYYDAVLVNVVCVDANFVKELRSRLDTKEDGFRLILYSSEVSRFLTGGERRMADRCLPYPFGLEKLDETVGSA